MRRSLDRLKDAQREELEDAQRRDRWYVRATRAGERLRGVVTFLGAVSAMVGAGAALYHRMRGVEVGPPELPATHQPTVATDHVDKAQLPKK